MDFSFPEYTTSLRKNIRKCRKKLRQIEALEVLKRSLSADEEEKIFRKNDIREELQYLISEYEGSNNPISNEEATNDDSHNSTSNADEMKRSHSSSSEDEEIQNNENELIQFTEAVTPKKVARADSDTQPNQIESQVPSAPSHHEVDGTTSSFESSANRDVLIPENDDSSVDPLQHDAPIAPRPSKANSSTSDSRKDVTSKKNKSTKKSRRNVKFSMTELAGHSDLALSVCCDPKYIISSSRDTTVKIWDAVSGEEINSLRGHTGAVTRVMLLTTDESKDYLSELPLPPSEKKQRLVITAATDCSVRIWSLETGKEYKSIYTYNGVSSVVYLSSIRCVLTGTDGGKLELWDALTGYNHHSLHSADEEIKCLKVLDDMIYSGTSDCILKVHAIRENKICTLFDTELEFLNTPHNLMDLSVHFDNIYCGDDHPNLKVVSWKSGRAQVMKLRNVKSGFGTSDALCITDSFLISSSYDLDTGESVLNVRKLPTADYLYTLHSSDVHVGRILSLAAINEINGKIQVVSAGQSLCVWNLHLVDNNPQTSDETAYHSVTYDKELAKPAIDSDDESEPENVESDDEESSDEEPATDEIVYESTTRPWYDSWCSIL